MFGRAGATSLLPCSPAQPPPAQRPHRLAGIGGVPAALAEELVLGVLDRGVGIGRLALIFAETLALLFVILVERERLGFFVGKRGWRAAGQMLAVAPVERIPLDPLEQPVPAFRDILARDLLTADLPGVVEQPGAESIVVASRGADQHAVVVVRLLLTVERPVEQRMGELLQPRLERDFPRERERGAGEAVAQFVG